MSENADRHKDPSSQCRMTEPSRGKGVIVGIVLVALILAIGFFYLTNALTKGAASVDETTRMVGDAARNAADALHNAN
jgi:hypothetical protein